MKHNKIPYIIGASSTALILLILIQVKWMHQSRELIENQFDQKVNMALCRAVDEFANCNEGEELVQACAMEPTSSSNCCSDRVSSFISSENILDQVKGALTFYDIDMAFELSVNEPALPEENECCESYKDRVYSCSLDPLIDNDDLELNINFPGKQAYVLKRMGFMLGLSILIMLFITGIFIYANFYLLQQKRLSERNKEFFNHMAHEFKTPLTNIGLASKMLSNRNKDPLLNIIIQENQQLNEQVNKVLSMASIEAGQFDLHKESTNLKDILDGVIMSMKMQILDKDADIKVEGINERMQIQADSFHLANALRNILENALKYNENKPRVYIKGRTEGDNILISIEDNGVGISEENQKLVFEKFYRIQNADSYQNKGFGLGLSYVKKIISLHDGDVRIISEWKKGTRFDLLLPRAI